MVFSVMNVPAATWQETKDKFAGYFEKPVSKADKVSPEAQAEQLLEGISADLKKVRTIVLDALEKKKFDKKALDAAIMRLRDYATKITLLETLDAATKNALKEQAVMISMAFQALQEETGVLELWLSGYDAYEKDLNDNFKNLPSAFLKRPDNKNLYKELGFASVAEGRRASFNAVRQNYQERFDTIKINHKNNFDENYFRPYLRVLDYLFKTPYSKKQYDAYLNGKVQYEAEVKPLKVYEGAIQKLFAQDLSELRVITGIIQSEMR